MSEPNTMRYTETDELINTNPSEVSMGENHNVMFFLMGNAALLAFNLIINAADIYVSITGRHDVGVMLNRAYNIPCALMAFVLCFYKPKNLKLVLLSALGILTGILIILPILLLVDITKDTAYTLTLMLVGLVGITSSILFSSSYSIASQFGPSAGGAVSSGNGCCGVIASVLRILTKAIISKDSMIVYSSAAYYFFAAAVIGFTLFYLYRKFQDPDVSAKINPEQDSTNIFSPQTVQTIKIIWPIWLADFLNFMITLSIFPGYVLQVPQSKGLGDWTMILVTTLFTVFDWVGRYYPAKFVWPKKEETILYPILCRFVFYLIFIISIQRIIKFSEPAWTLVWMVIFALTNGYFGTVAMIHGSNHHHLTQEQKRFAGLLMSFAINSGILTAMGLTFAMPSPPKTL